MKEKSNLSKWNYYFVLGSTFEETVMLDFDNTTFKTVRYWASRVMKRYKLEGFIILKSSKNCYHVVFDRKVSWEENMKIVAWVALSSHNSDLVRWFLLQCIKKGSTLRVSPKYSKHGLKPSPRIVFRYGREDNEIESFLKSRAEIKNMIRKLKAD